MLRFWIIAAVCAGIGYTLFQNSHRHLTPSAASRRPRCRSGHFDHSPALVSRGRSSRVHEHVPAVAEDRSALPLTQSRQIAPRRHRRDEGLPREPVRNARSIVPVQRLEELIAGRRPRATTPDPCRRTTERSARLASSRSSSAANQGPSRVSHGEMFQISTRPPPGLEDPRDLGERLRVREPVERLRREDGIRDPVGERHLPSACPTCASTPGERPPKLGEHPLRGSTAMTRSNAATKSPRQLPGPAGEIDHRRTLAESQSAARPSRSACRSDSRGAPPRTLPPRRRTSGPADRSDRS